MPGVVAAAGRSGAAGAYQHLIASPLPAAAAAAARLQEGEEGAEEDEGGSGRQVDVEAITAQEQAEFDWWVVVRG